MAQNFEDSVPAAKARVQEAVRDIQQSLSDLTAVISRDKNWDVNTVLPLLYELSNLRPLIEERIETIELMLSIPKGTVLRRN